jgi:hypothetical protein
MSGGAKGREAAFGTSARWRVRQHHRPLKHDWLRAYLLLDSCAKVMRQPSWNLRHSAE